jgi:general secretion pathway protein H
MPTLGTGTSTSNPVRPRPRAGARGFTLIEMMIVVAIIGIFVAGVVIYLSGDRRDTKLDEEAQRLDALFDYVREQAELQTRDYGFRVNSKNYSFVAFDIRANQWRPADEDDALRERPFDPGMRPTVVVEGRTIVLDAKKKNIEDFTPQVMIFANGDLTSFEVTLQNERGDRARVYSDEQTNIRLALPGKEESPDDPRAAQRQ